MSAPARTVDAGERQHRVLVSTAGSLWHQLPARAGFGLALTLALVPPVGLAVIGLAPLAPLLGAVLLGPLWSISVGTFGGHPRAVWRWARSGALLALLPAALTSALVVSVPLTRSAQAPPWLPTATGVQFGALVLCALAMWVAFPLAVRHGSGSWQWWIAGLNATVRDTRLLAMVVTILVVLIGVGSLLGPATVPFLAVAVAAFPAAWSDER